MPDNDTYSLLDPCIIYQNYLHLHLHCSLKIKSEGLCLAVLRIMFFMDYWIMRSSVLKIMWISEHWFQHKQIQMQIKTVIFTFSELCRYSDWLWGGRPELTSRQGKDFSLLHSVQPGSGAHPASYPMGTGGSFSWVKRSDREADRSPPSSAEVVNTWSYTSILTYECGGVQSTATSIGKLYSVEC
jgi:hypothetical protein